MNDFAWILVLQPGLLWCLGHLLADRGRTVRDLPAVQPAAGPLSEQTAQVMIERAYSTTMPGETCGQDL